MHRNHDKISRETLLNKLFRGQDPFATWRNHSGKLADHSYPHTGLTGERVGNAINQLSKRGFDLDLIVEVGSFKGGSAIVIASELKALGLKTQLLCIDTFLGDANMRADRGGALDWLELEGGHPTVFDQFMANIVDRGHQDIVLPLVASSAVGLHIMSYLGLRCPLAYLDSAHEPGETLMELRLLAQIMPRSSIILGDDFNWQPVCDDAVIFSKEHSLIVAPNGRDYAIDLR